MKFPKKESKDLIVMTAQKLVRIRDSSENLGKERDWAVSLQPRRMAILKKAFLGLNHRLVMTMKSFSNFDTVWVSCHVWSARFNPPEQSFRYVVRAGLQMMPRSSSYLPIKLCFERRDQSRSASLLVLIAEISTFDLKGKSRPCAHDPQGTPLCNFTSQSN